MALPAVSSEGEQLLQEQLKHECQQFEAWKLVVEHKILTLVQPQAQAPVIQSGPGAEKIDLRDAEVRSVTLSLRGVVKLRSWHLLVPNVSGLLL